ncbi:hypothetical protein [Nakamurella deserti]|uniref:hypothetical protein n=1 Tax=Nakamurella deserti TaxID=2164074 RepID=UPI000DBE3D00|nr:hypothetical protein [Nakamurella deserti]
MRRLGAIATVLAILTTSLVGGWSPVQAFAASQDIGEFHLTAPTRIVDTRINLGHTGPLASNEAAVIDPRVVAPDLFLANAYVVNVTVVDPSAPGNIELAPWAGPNAGPSKSSAVNFVAGRTVANLATAWTDLRDMRLAVVNRSVGATQVVVDVLGYYSFGTSEVSPGMMAPRTTASFGRVLDTRRSGSVPANGSVTVAVAGIADANLGTALANVTVVDARAPGHVTADAQDRTSVVNYTTGDTVANLAYLPIQNGRTVTLYNRSTGPIDLVVDIAGEFYANNAPREAGVPLYDGRFVSVPTARLVDTRINLGAPGPVASDGSFRVQPTGLPANATAVVVNLTTTEATAPGSVVAWATGTREPSTSNVNVAVGRSVANLAIVPLGADRSITVLSHNVGRVQLIVDVAGYYVGA